MEPNPLNTDLKICSSASLDVGLSAALQYHQNSYVKIIRNVIYRMDPFCICQQAGSDRPCMYFSCSVAHPNGFPPEYSIVATFEVVNGHPQIYGWLVILDGKDHTIICVLTGNFCVSSMPLQIKLSCSGPSSVGTKFLMVLGTRQHWAWEKLMQSYCLCARRSVLSQCIRRSVLTEINMFCNWNHWLMSLLVWQAAQPGGFLPTSHVGWCWLAWPASLTGDTHKWTTY